MVAGLSGCLAPFVSDSLGLELGKHRDSGYYRRLYPEEPLFPLILKDEELRHGCCHGGQAEIDALVQPWGDPSRADPAGAGH